MGVPPYLLADSLALTQAQRLVRRLCTFCRKPAALSPGTRAIFKANQIPIPEDVTVVSDKGGCSECAETGYMGRMALMEICPADDALGDMIGRNAPQSEMRRIAVQKGMLSLYQEGLQQVLAGNTSMSEISCLSYTSVAVISEDEDTPDGKIVGMPVDSDSDSDPAPARKIVSKPQ